MIGCGPVGLGVILMLKAAGVKTVVASDFSPNRRKLAEQCGADIVVDPKETSPFANWKEFGLLGNVSDAINIGMGLFDKLQATRLPWWHGWRMIDKLGALPNVLSFLSVSAYRVFCSKLLKVHLCFPELLGWACACKVTK